MTNSFVVDVNEMKDCRSKHTHLKLTMINVMRKTAVRQNRQFNYEYSEFHRNPVLGIHVLITEPQNTAGKEVHN